MKFNIIFIFLFLTLNLHSQEKKYIQVTGSAEMLVEPNEFTLLIEIEEYYEEEFETSKVKKYKTKIDINTIESQLIQDLKNLGISKENIKSVDIGNSWKYSGKSFLATKELEITLKDFNYINRIMSNLDRKGIDNIKIGELRHTNITELRKEVKINAILAAKEKAEYLLNAVGEELGKVISITEVNPSNYWWQGTPSTSNSMTSYRNNNRSDEEGKNIRLRFEISAKFEIK